MQKKRSNFDMGTIGHFAATVAPFHPLEASKATNSRAQPKAREEFTISHRRRCYGMKEKKAKNFELEESQ